MTVFFWQLLKRDLSSVRYGTPVHWTSHFLQGKWNTRPCITGDPVVPEALTVEGVKEGVPCPVRYAAATVSLSSLSVLVGLTSESSLVYLTLGCPLKWSMNTRLGLYRISGLHYIRYPAGYPVLFAGYPVKLLNKWCELRMSKLLSV